jgi:YfiH family protein
MADSAGPVPQPLFWARLDPDHHHGVGVAVTTRHGGVSAPPFDSLNLGNTSQADPGAVVANLESVRRALGLPALVGLRQVHSARVVAVGQTSGVVPAWAEADAMVTTVRRVGLLIRAADCLPVLLADAAAGVVAAAHAGRVGLLAGILPAVVEAMRRQGGQDLTAWIGPHVCPLCYEVPPAMAEGAWQRWPATRAVSRQGTPAIDLAAGAAAQLAGLGCHVHRLGPCTAETPDLFSHRRDGVRSGRLGAVVWLA